MRSLVIKQKIFKSLGMVLVLGLMTAVVVAGCGGGEGGSSLAMIEYSGVTTPAILTDQNAEQIVLDAYEGGSVSEGLGGIGFGLVSESDNVTPVALRINGVLKDVLDNMDPGGAASGLFTGVTQSMTMPGDCTGNASMTVTVNESTGSFSMTMTFSNYSDFCGDGTMSGTVVASGNMSMPDPNDPDTWEINGNMTMSLYSLTFSDSVESISVGGSWTIVTSVDQSTEEIYFWYVVRDNNTGVTYKMGDSGDQCHLLVTDNITTDDVVMDGVVYHPDHGWVNFSMDMTIDNFTDLPTSGTISVFDQAGSSAVLTVPSDHPPYDYMIDINIFGGAQTHIDGYWQSD